MNSSSWTIAAGPEVYYHPPGQQHNRAEGQGWFAFAPGHRAGGANGHRSVGTEVLLTTVRTETYGYIQTVLSAGTIIVWRQRHSRTGTSSRVCAQ